MPEEIYIANAARKRIEGETKQDLSQWSGPVVTVQGSEYKVEWRPPAIEDVDWNAAVLTIYNDGGWELYTIDGKSFNGKMMRLHDRRWIWKSVKEGTYVGHARSSWVYFKNISLGGHS